MTYEPVVFQTVCITADTDYGYEVVPLRYIIEDTGMKATEVGIAIKEDSRSPAIVEALVPYMEGLPNSNGLLIEEGWLAYMTMPGYLDRTDYTLHESEDEARAYLDEVYGGEEE